jgi:lipopolysaccharide export system permease protein
MFLKRIDKYIIKKFLGTYVLSILLIISIAVVFDISEKLDNFFEHQAPLEAIVFDYYLNFIPYFATLFSPLFVFIAVIFFTSKMAANTEIIAILSSGVSFRRMMLPYAISATIIAIFTFYINSYVIPKDNAVRINFENTYVKKKSFNFARNIQMEIEPGVIVYLERYEKNSQRGYSFSIEKFEDKKLVSRLTAKTIEWDSLYHWKINKYLIRNFDGLVETIETGYEKDTIIMMQPSDFFITKGMQEQMTLSETQQLLGFTKNKRSRKYKRI